MDLQLVTLYELRDLKADNKTRSGQRKNSSPANTPSHPDQRYGRDAPEGHLGWVSEPVNPQARAVGAVKRLLAVTLSMKRR
jgi:hypothetical protein